MARPAEMNPYVRSISREYVTHYVLTTGKALTPAGGESRTGINGLPRRCGTVAEGAGAGASATKADDPRSPRDGERALQNRGGSGTAACSVEQSKTGINGLEVGRQAGAQRC